MRLEVIAALVLAALAVLLFSVRRALLRIPRGLCTVELLGRQRIRGTVRVLWLGPIPWFEVTSAELGHEGEIEGLFGHGAIFRLRPMSAEDVQDLEGERAHRLQFKEEEDRRDRERAEEHARLVADAPKYTHCPGLAGITLCDVPSKGLCLFDDGFDCPHCKTLDENIPF